MLYQLLSKCDKNIPINQFICNLNDLLRDKLKVWHAKRTMIYLRCTIEPEKFLLKTHLNWRNFDSTLSFRIDSAVTITPTIWSLSGKVFFSLKIRPEMHSSKNKSHCKFDRLWHGANFSLFYSMAILNNRFCNTNQAFFFICTGALWIHNFWPFKMTELKCKKKNQKKYACFGQLNSIGCICKQRNVTYVKRIVKHSLWLFRTKHTST